MTCLFIQGCVTLYGDPSDVLQQGFDVMDLLGTSVDLAEEEEQDPRKIYAVRKHSDTLPDQDDKADKRFRKSFF